MDEDISIGAVLPKASRLWNDPTTRIIYPGGAYTLDHVPGRLNIALDHDDTVERIWMG